MKKVLSMVLCLIMILSSVGVFANEVELAAETSLDLPVLESKTYRFEYSKEETATDWGTPTVNNNPGKAYVGTSANKTTKYDNYTYVKFDASALIGKAAENAVLKMNFIRNYNSGKRLQVYSADIKSDLDNSVVPTNKTLIAESIDVTSGSNAKELMTIDVTSAVTGGQYIEFVLYSDAYGNSPGSIPYVFIDETAMITCTGVVNACTVIFANTMGATVNPINAKEGDAIVLPNCTSTASGYAFAGWSDGTTKYAAGDNYTVPANDITLTAMWNISLPVAESKIYRFEYSKEASASDWGTPTVNNNPGKAYVGTSASATLKYDAYTYVKFDASALTGKAAEKAVLNINFIRNWNAGKVLEVYSADIKSDLDSSVVPANKNLIAQSIEVTAGSNVKELMKVDITSAITGGQYIELVLYSSSWGNDPNCVPYVFIDNETAVVCENIEALDGFYSVAADGKLTEINKLSAGKIRCYTQVDVNADGTATPIIALYKGEALDKVVVGEKVNTVAGTNYVSVDIDLTGMSLDSSYELIRFVFNDLKAATPLVWSETLK